MLTASRWKASLHPLAALQPGQILPQAMTVVQSDVPRRTVVSGPRATRRDWLGGPGYEVFPGDLPWQHRECVLHLS